MPATAVPTLAQYLDQPLSIGDPDVVGPLTVFPLFGPAPRLKYVAFAQGVARGVRVSELADGASVNDLSVLNPLDVGVLLYDGEEVLGAQQNRTFDVSVMVPAGAKLDVPVSCVEEGRWDGRRHGESFAPSAQAAYPELRRSKARAVRTRVAAGLDARAAQGEVWSEVAAKSRRLSVASRTGAMHDIYEDRRGAIATIRGGIRSHEGQIGMLAAIGGKFTVLDHASRSEVFASLAEPLIQGYVLDALEALPADAPSASAAEAFLERVWEQRLVERDGIGLGRDGRFEGRGVAGAALLCGDELVQLTAFGDDDAAPSVTRRRAPRIRRPSRRGSKE